MKGKRLVLIVGAALVLAGCKAINTGIDKAAAVGHALVDTTEIVKAASDDVQSVWAATGLVKGVVDEKPVSEPVSGPTK